MEPRRKNRPLARTLTFCVCDLAKRLFGFDQCRTRAVLWHVRASGRATLSKRERATGLEARRIHKKQCMRHPCSREEGHQCAGTRVRRWGRLPARVRGTLHHQLEILDEARGQGVVLLVVLVAARPGVGGVENFRGHAVASLGTSKPKTGSS